MSSYHFQIFKTILSFFKFIHIHNIICILLFKSLFILQIHFLNSFFDHFFWKWIFNLWF